ncbi:MAG: hypothetical protein ABMA64_42465, partial [Myxococcota bacterium]
PLGLLLQTARLPMVWPHWFARAVWAVLAVELLVVGAVVATLAWTTPAGDPVEPTASVASAARPAPRAAAPVAGDPGELQLITMAAVQVMVDGAPIGFDSRQGYLEQLAPGTHRLQILNLLGATITEREVEILSNQRTQLRYADKVLSDQGRMPMRGRPVAPAPEAAAVVVETPAVVVEAPAVEVHEVDPTLAGTVDASLSIGQGPNAVEIRLPKLGIGRR